MKRTFPLHIHISILFLSLILLVGGSIGSIGYKLSRDMLETMVSGLTDRISRETFSELQRSIAPAEMATNVLSHDALIESRSLPERLRRLSFMRKMLDSSALVSSLYVGYASGDFFYIRRVHNDKERDNFKAPHATRYIVQSIEHAAGGVRGRYVFIDDALKILGEEDRPEFARTYDPRAQDWYKKAMAAPGQVKLEPHLLFSYRRVGASIATHMQNKRGVVGADILLDTLNEHLAQQKVTPNTQVVLAHPLGLVIAHENANRLIAAPEMSDATPRFTRIDELGSPVLSVLAKQIKTMPNTASTRRITMADGDWRVTIHPLQLEGAPPLFLINAIPESELLASVLELRSTSIWATAIIILLAAPIA
ncbi:MAG TPA: hypothetical protein VJ001_18265, partial [Rhodocyclaceae bacterium]|nr:hypothetical protein [Rhodocyclaceae bacterium]